MALVTRSNRAILIRTDIVSDVEKERALSGGVPANMYENMCVPDLGAYLDYNQPPPMMPADDRKMLTATPAPPTHNTPSPATPAPNNNNFLEGKSLYKDFFMRGSKRELIVSV